MHKDLNFMYIGMGEPIKIVDLAKKMIQLSGLELCNEENPQGDIEIKFVGLRPGEKLYEELLVGKNTTQTENPRIMCANEEMIEWSLLKPMLEELESCSNNTDQLKIRELLVRIVPEYNPKSQLVDLLFDNSKFTP